MTFYDILAIYLTHLLAMEFTLVQCILFFEWRNHRGKHK